MDILLPLLILSVLGPLPILLFVIPWMACRPDDRGRVPVRWAPLSAGVFMLLPFAIGLGVATPGGRGPMDSEWTLFVGILLMVAGAASHVARWGALYVRGRAGRKWPRAGMSHWLVARMAVLATAWVSEAGVILIVACAIWLAVDEMACACLAEAPLRIVERVRGRLGRYGRSRGVA